MSLHGFCLFAGQSVNQPRLCASAQWSTDATNWATNNTVGNLPNTVFITANNSVLVTADDLAYVPVWESGSLFPTRNISANLSQTVGLFVSGTSDVYIDNGFAFQRVEKWSSNTTVAIGVMNVTSKCFGLFVDKNNTLYCSLVTSAQVVMRSLESSSLAPSRVVGTGINGATSIQLDNPSGIFVHTNFDLYVADCNNNRVQMFPTQNQSATTIAGSGATGTIILNQPSAVVLDAAGYLFIVDSDNHRVVGSGPNGFRCILACTSSNGSGSNQLRYPSSLSFDINGNLFVIDRGNSRIQKFALTTNSCGKSLHLPPDRHLYLTHQIFVSSRHSFADVLIYQLIDSVETLEQRCYDLEETEDRAGSFENKVNSR